MTELQIKNFYTEFHRAESIYQYVPFEVPIGTEAITIGARHDGKVSVIDLGLFDPIGFRGWSGSARDQIIIAPDRATPGYLPGPIRSGTWFLSLGLHRVDAEGVTVEVSVELGKPNFPELAERAPRPIRPPRRNLPVESGFRWFPADFHTHSLHSDGKLTLDDLATLAAGRGLELLAITDHNTTSHHQHLAEISNHVGINLLAGQEVTTDTGHANAFGEIGWVDFREATEKWLSETNSRGGIFSINHPLAGPCSWARDVPACLQVSEVWHSSWDQIGDEPIQWWNENGRPIPIGGSDFHRFGSDGLPGEPTTWIKIATEDNEVTESQVLAAMAAGNVAISANPSAPVVIPIEDEIAVIDGEDCILTTPSGEKKVVRKNFFTIASETGIYTLQDQSGKYQALGYLP